MSDNLLVEVNPKSNTYSLKEDFSNGNNCYFPPLFKQNMSLF